MATLTIDLQDGFEGETVVIRVNGTEVYHKGHVVTNYAISLADTVRVQVPEGDTEVEVALPDRHLIAKQAFEIHEPTNLWVSVIEKHIQYRVSDEEGLYL